MRTTYGTFSLQVEPACCTSRKPPGDARGGTVALGAVACRQHRAEALAADTRQSQLLTRLGYGLVRCGVVCVCVGANPKINFTRKV